MQKKLRVLVVAILVAIFAVPAMQGAGNRPKSSLEEGHENVFGAGDGSRQHPYIIYTAKQLEAFANNVWKGDYNYNSLHIQLGNDIVLNENLLENQSGAKLFQPIGSEGTFSDGKFMGEFDGCGHAIYGLYITAESRISGYVGLFGTVKGNGEVKNLHVKDAIIDLTNFNKHNLYVGGIVGYTADYAKVTNCTFEGKIYGNSRCKYEGGIVGYHNSYTDITGCHFKGEIGVNNDGKSADYLGGIAGYSYSSISDCTMEGFVRAGQGSAGAYVGGIVGLADGKVVYCKTINSGQMLGGYHINGTDCKWVGGIAGKAKTVIHCQNHLNVVCKSKDMRVGGIVGECEGVQYSGNFGEVQCDDKFNNPLGIDQVWVGGIAGKCGAVVACANYNKVKVADMNIITSKREQNAYIGGIAGQATVMGCCLNMGEMRTATLSNTDGSLISSNVAYGLSGVAGVDNTGHSRYYNIKAQSGMPGDNSGSATLEQLQGKDFLDTYSLVWSMPWGIEMTNKYPAPVRWGGVERDFALSGAEGYGTAEQPYLVGSIEAFEKINSLLNSRDDGLSGVYFKQVADLDFAGGELTPIGVCEGATTVKSFKGHYDGGGYTVRNAKITRSYENFGIIPTAGFIARMETEGTLSNLNFESVEVEATGNCYAGVAVGAYINYTEDATTPLSGINLINCHVTGDSEAIVGSMAGLFTTDDREISAANPEKNTIKYCTVQYCRITSSRVGGGLVGLGAWTIIDHCTVKCELKAATEAVSGRVILGGLIGQYALAGSYRPYSSSILYSVVIPTFVCEEVLTGEKQCFFGGIVGMNDDFGWGDRFIINVKNTLIDDKMILADSNNVYEGSIVGRASYWLSVNLRYVHFATEGKDEEPNFCGWGNNTTFGLGYDEVYNTFGKLYGWSAYFLNGNSNDGDMKWGYYYPTVSSVAIPATSGNGRYSHYDLKYPLLVTPPEHLMVDFTLPECPLDNNVIVLRENTRWSQMLVAAKPNVVSTNGVASRFYLNDKMDYTYPNSFHAYAVHYENADAGKWQVLCLPFEVHSTMLPEGCKMLGIEGYVSGVVCSKEIEMAKAGEPFIFYSPEKAVIDYNEYNSTIVEKTVAGKFMTGTFAATTASAGDYVLSDDGSKFVRLTEATTIEALRGYVPAAKFPGGGDEVQFVIDAYDCGDIDTPGAGYRINFDVQGVRSIGGVLYSCTGAESVAPSRPIEGHHPGDDEDSNWADFDQRDWIGIKGLGWGYEGALLAQGFYCYYDGSILVPAGVKIIDQAPDYELNIFTAANVLHGNYTNYADSEAYWPFYVAPKVNEVAKFKGFITTIDGEKYLYTRGNGLLNGKGVKIEGASEELVDDESRYRIFEGVLVADAEANGGKKIIFSKYLGTTTKVDDAVSSDAVVYGTEGAVVIEGAEGVARIYTAGGAVVKQVAVSGGKRVALAPGLYIVELGGIKVKVAVK